MLMDEKYIISKNRKLPPAQDYELLRAEGLKYIEQLAHRLWTDYNAHDPGITILEALSFAITELGYRADFQIVDLMASKDGRTDAGQAFFTAREIMSCAPLTVNDYRKLLADTPGVHNAWLFPKVNVDIPDDSNIVPASEVALFPSVEKDELSYLPDSDKITPIKIRGLYDVLLDLENTDEYGDLNTGNINYTIYDSYLNEIRLEIILPKWNEADHSLMEAIFSKKAQLREIVITEENKAFRVRTIYDLTGETKSFDYLINFLINLSEEQKGEIKKQLQKDESALHHSIFKAYYEKLQVIISGIEAAQRKLSAHRNLCEDFKNIGTVTPVNVAFCADVEVSPEADIERILAEIYFQIESYFDPDIKFYSLREMVEKNIPSEQIFEGPKLEHGFIDTEELKNTSLRTEIRTSDIINFIMDIKGVLSVKNVMLTDYNQLGQPGSSGQKWSLVLKEYHKAVLDIDRSKVLFFKGKLPVRAKRDETEDILFVLKGKNSHEKLSGHQQDRLLPKGVHYQFDEYTSIQPDLPETYGVGAAGLPPDATDERRAQALQLQAYLTFFDQILAGFFSQLYHAKDLFRIDDDAEQTYFNQYLSELKNIDKLYKTVADFETKEQVSLKDIFEMSDYSSGSVSKKKAVKNQFEKLMESEKTFFDRKNRFLDHLLARFSESFNEYVLMLYTVSGNEKVSKAQKRLIEDKSAFLRDYPTISNERGKAFDYLGEIWNSENVSGIEKRIARYTGIADYSRRNLFCVEKIEIANMGSENQPQYMFEISSSSSDNKLIAAKTFETYREAEEVLNKLYVSLPDKGRYRMEISSPSQIFVKLLDEWGNEVAVSDTYFTKDENARLFIDELANKFSSDCDEEGMYLIEHLLLRPHFTPDNNISSEPESDYKLMQVSLEKEHSCCDDPYSFRLSVILPYWLLRFRDMDFRRFFENTIKAEAPAHVFVKVCWINHTAMSEFQTYYQNWLTALKNYKEQPTDSDDEKKNALMKANNKMVDFLNHVHSEYPEARLYDCDTEITNPVLLGSTKLGTF